MDKILFLISFLLKNYHRIGWWTQTIFFSLFLNFGGIAIKMYLLKICCVKIFRFLVAFSTEISAETESVNDHY
jgi:hypothetical protein